MTLKVDQVQYWPIIKQRQKQSFIMKKNFLQRLSKLSKLADQTIRKMPPNSSRNIPFSNKWLPLSQLKDKYFKVQKKKKGFFETFMPSVKPKEKSAFDKLKQYLPNNTFVPKKESPNKIQDMMQEFKDLFENKSKDWKKNLNVMEQKLQQTKSSLAENLKQVKKKSKSSLAENLKEVKKKSGEASILLESQAQSLKQGISNSKEYLSRKSVQIPKKLGQVSQKAYEGLKQNIDVKKKVKKSFNFIFWRVSLLFMMIAFFYGLGSSLPKVIKLLFQQQFLKSPEKPQAERVLSSRVQ